MLRAIHRRLDTPQICISIWPCQTSAIQERIVFGDAVEEVFPGCPKIRNGMMYANDVPGLGIDINEKLAAKYPFPERTWQLRPQAPA